MKLIDYNNILILNTAFLGDVTLSLFLCKNIKLINPNCKITFITTKEAAPILNLSLNIDKVIILDKKEKHKSIKDINNFIQELNLNQYDLFINLHKSYRSGYLLKNISSKLKIAFKDAHLSSFANYRIAYPLHLHEVQRQNSILKVFEEYNNFKLEEFVKPDLIFTNNNLLTDAFDDKKQIICLAPGSVWKTKQWSIDGFVEVINYFYDKYNLCLIGGGGDSYLSDEIYNRTNNKFIDLIGKLNLPDSMQLISLSKLLLSNDSAPTHFASILNIPNLTIFGPTIPEFGFSPISINSSTISLNLNCSPCHHHGLNVCPLNHHNCMNKLSAESVINKMSELLSE